MSYLRNSYRRLRYGAPIIVVSGLPRSGTSMAMQMLAAGGAAIVTDGVREPGEDNPRGYFEDERVKDLHREGEDKSWLTETRGRAIKVISFLLRDLPATNSYKVIFMRRNLPEVLASQRKLLERRGETDQTSDEKMIEIWQDHLRKTSYLLKHAAHFDFIDLSYQGVVANPLEHARSVRDFLGRALDVAQMAAAVDGTLYRNRSGGV